MCNPISLILTEDKVFLPPENIWNHSHSVIIETHNIPNGLIGDKYLRLEVSPPEENIFRDKETNERLEVDDTWKVILDEENTPDWYSTDKPNQEDRARTAANKWLKNCPDNLVPDYKESAGNRSTLIGGHGSTLTGVYCSKLTGGYGSKLTAGHDSTLTGGDESVLNAGNDSILTARDFSTLTSEYTSTLNAGNYSILTAGYGSVLTAGYNSILTAGNYSILTAYNDSIFCAGEGSSFSLIWYDAINDRMRTATVYVGENGIEPNKKYLGKNGEFTEVKE